MTTVFQNFFFFFPIFLLWALRYILYLILEDLSPSADHSLLNSSDFLLGSKIMTLENPLCAVLSPPGVLISCWLLMLLSFSSSSNSGCSFSPWRPDPLMWMIIVHCLLPPGSGPDAEFFAGPLRRHLKEVSRSPFSRSPFSVCPPGLRAGAHPAVQAGQIASLPGPPGPPARGLSSCSVQANQSGNGNIYLILFLSFVSILSSMYFYDWEKSAGL